MDMVVRVPENEEDQRRARCYRLQIIILCIAITLIAGVIAVKELSSYVEHQVIL